MNSIASPTATVAGFAQHAKVAFPTRGCRGVVEGIVLAADQYYADHAYRVTVSCGTKVAGQAIVYLAPPPFQKRRAVKLDENEVARGDGGATNELALVAKGSL